MGTTRIKTKKKKPALSACLIYKDGTVSFLERGPDRWWGSPRTLTEDDPLLIRDLVRGLTAPEKA